MLQVINLQRQTYDIININVHPINTGSLLVVLVKTPQGM